MVDTDRRIHELAAPQHGVFSRTQARDRGLTRRHLAVRIRNGSLIALSGEVLAVAGAASSPHQRAIAAVLAAGPSSALSHSSAAAFWRLAGYELLPLHVIRARGRRVHESRLSVVHTTTCLPDRHITVVDGLPLTVPVRVLFDLAGTMHPGRLARLVDAAWRQRLVSGRLLRRTLAELAEHGRPGITDMREICDARGDGYRPPDSNLEARFQELMAQINIRSFVRQVDVGGMDWSGRVDFLDPDLRLIAEIDSDTYHLSLTDQADDDRRREKLEADGFTVEQIREVDVWHHPSSVQEQIRRARRAAARNLLSERAGSGADEQQVAER